MLFHIKMGQGTTNGLSKFLTQTLRKQNLGGEKRQNLGEQIKLFVIFIF